MYAYLGTIEFETIGSFDSYELSGSANFAQFDVLEGKPKLHFTGTGLDELNLKISFHADFCHPETEIKKLLAAKNSGESLPLIFSNGDYVNDFVIKTARKTLESTDPEGNVICASFDINLLENPITEKQKQERERAAIQKRNTNPNTATVMGEIPKTEMPKFPSLLDIVRSNYDIIL